MYKKDIATKGKHTSPCKHGLTTSVYNLSWTWRYNVSFQVACNIIKHFYSDWDGTRGTVRYHLICFLTSYYDTIYFNHRLKHNGGCGNGRDKHPAIRSTLMVRLQIGGTARDCRSPPKHCWNRRSSLLYYLMTHASNPWSHWIHDLLCSSLN